MSHCQIFAICFMADQRGDPAGDDGLMSPDKPQESVGKNIMLQLRLCFNFTFSRAKYFHPLGLHGPLLNFYDTFMSV